MFVEESKAAIVWFGSSDVITRRWQRHKEHEEQTHGHTLRQLEYKYVEKKERMGEKTKQKERM